MPQSKVVMRYEDAIATGQLRPDEAQRQVALRFGKAVADLEAQDTRPSLLARLARRKPDPVRGIYLWGGVGRGKSMLMDLFFDCVGIAEKRRVHFHEFMQEVHDRLRIERSKETGDPILPVADAIAAETRLIAFDEMIVTNSADAMILSRLFTRIIAQGVTVVATSNRPPQDLYKNGSIANTFCHSSPSSRIGSMCSLWTGQRIIVCSVWAASRPGMCRMAMPQRKP